MGKIQLLYMSNLRILKQVFKIQVHEIILLVLGTFYL